MKLIRLLALSFCLLMLALPNLAHAVCDQSGASTADKDLWNTHGCDKNFFLWSYKAYDQRESDWTGRGWKDACNVKLEFPKHWNATYLVTYGLQDANCCSWHGTADYRPLAEAADSSFHSSIYHDAKDGTANFGGWTWHPFDSNEVTTFCPLYNKTVANANPASRAGDFMHEGWHGWLDKYDWDNGSCGGHRCGTPGNCTAKDACDYFYFHGVGKFAFGALYQTDGTAAKFHSPNQVQVEFLCDVADYPKGWVPNSVRLAARTDADTRSAQRFINGPGYKCGNPRPW